MPKLIDKGQIKKDQTTSKYISARKSVRYIRKDLKVYLTKYRFLNSRKPLKTKLIDISSNGVQVATSKELGVNKKLSVIIYFSDGCRFDISGKIVNHKKKYSYIYDLAFESIDHVIDTEKATLNLVYLFDSSSQINCKYGDFTSSGIQLLTDEILETNNKVTLKLQFSDGKTYQTNAKIIHYKKLIKNHYGIKFEKSNHMLGDYLLQSQKNLSFG